MNSVLLRIASRPLGPLVVAFAIYILFRGHNEPGGGFIGGLMLSLSAILHALAFGTAEARRKIRLDPVSYLALGWGLAISSGLVGPALGLPFMTGVVFAETWLPLVGHSVIGSVFQFDCGVFFIVFGTICQVLFALLEKDA